MHSAIIVVGELVLLLSLT